MPELLETGTPGVTAILIPATITFTPGALYQLWLVGINSKGSGTPGPRLELDCRLIDSPSGAPHARASTGSPQSTTTHIGKLERSKHTGLLN